MKTPKSSLIIGIIVIAASVAAITGVAMYKSKSTSNDRRSAVTATSQSTSSPKVAYVPGLPVRLLIPKINVDAKIDSMGLTANGDLDDPEDIANAGWYNAGPRAGSQGTAVMDGHFGGTLSKPAVFDNLHTLKVGDQIMVEDSDKTTHTYVVRGTKTYQPEADASEVFRSNDKEAHLNLITCQGEWVGSKESYSSRLVVFTDLLAKN